MMAVKIVENNTMYSVQELHLCLLSLWFTSSTVSVHSSTNLSTNFFPALIIFIVQHIISNITRFITFTLTITRIPNKYFITHTFVNHFFCILQRCLLLQALSSSLHLHLHASCRSRSLVSLVLDIRLNTLTFKFFTTSGTHIFAYGSLILLQLPLHLLFLMLK